MTDHDTIPLPRALTAENGAKAALSGEFFVTTRQECPECEGTGDIDGDSCDECEGSGQWSIREPIPWTTIKAIWRRAVEHFEKQGD